jgi:hypothetical protein
MQTAEAFSMPYEVNVSELHTRAFAPDCMIIAAVAGTLCSRGSFSVFARQQTNTHMLCVCQTAKQWSYATIIPHVADD